METNEMKVVTEMVEEVLEPAVDEVVAGTSNEFWKGYKIGFGVTLGAIALGIVTKKYIIPKVKQMKEKKMSGMHTNEAHVEDNGFEENNVIDICDFGKESNEK